MSTGNAHHGGMLVPEATQIETASGRFVDVLDPDPAALDPADIAHALAMTCRYGGHVARFYSVAEHAILVEDLVRTLSRDVDLYLAAALHDAAEAYLGDVVSPLKYALRSLEHRSSMAFCDLDGFRGSYKELTQRMERALGERFSIDPALFDHPTIARADMWALAIEARELTHTKGANWRWPGEIPNDGDLPRSVTWIGGLSPEGVEPIYLARLRHLLHVRDLAEAA
jgi:uncharacterized protein